MSRPPALTTPPSLPTNPLSFRHLAAVLVGHGALPPIRHGGSGSRRPVGPRPEHTRVVRLLVTHAWPAALRSLRSHRGDHTSTPPRRSSQSQRSPQRSIRRSSRRQRSGPLERFLHGGVWGSTGTGWLQRRDEWRTGQREGGATAPGEQRIITDQCGLQKIVTDCNVPQRITTYNFVSRGLCGGQRGRRHSPSPPTTRHPTLAWPRLGVLYKYIRCACCLSSGS